MVLYSRSLPTKSVFCSWYSAGVLPAMIESAFSSCSDKMDLPFRELRPNATHSNHMLRNWDTVSVDAPWSGWYVGCDKSSAIGRSSAASWALVSLARFALSARINAYFSLSLPCVLDMLSICVCVPLSANSVRSSERYPSAALRRLPRPLARRVWAASTALADILGSSGCEEREISEKARYTSTRSVSELARARGTRFVTIADSVAMSTPRRRCSSIDMARCIMSSRPVSRARRAAISTAVVLMSWRCSSERLPDTKLLG